MARPEAPQLRRRQIAAIHAAAKELHMDEDTRRALIERVTGARSSADLDGPGRAAVLAELRRLGAGRVGHARPHPGRPRNMAARPMLARIEQLLADMKLTWAYADGIARRMFGIERLSFADAPKLRAVIAALYVEQKRRAADPGRSAR